MARCDDPDVMIRVLVLLLAVLVLSGCKSMPGWDGEYSTPARGGWDNFRA